MGNGTEYDTKEHDIAAEYDKEVIERLRQVVPSLLYNDTYRDLIINKTVSIRLPLKSGKIADCDVVFLQKGDEYRVKTLKTEPVENDIVEKDTQKTMHLDEKLLHASFDQIHKLLVSQFGGHLKPTGETIETPVVHTNNRGSEAEVQKDKENAIASLLVQTGLMEQAFNSLCEVGYSGYDLNYLTAFIGRINDFSDAFSSLKEDKDVYNFFNERLIRIESGLMRLKGNNDMLANYLYCWATRGMGRHRFGNATIIESKDNNLDNFFFNERMLKVVDYLEEVISVFAGEGNRNIDVLINSMLSDEAFNISDHDENSGAISITMTFPHQSNDSKDEAAKLSIDKLKSFVNNVDNCDLVVDNGQQTLLFSGYRNKKNKLEEKKPSDTTRELGNNYLRVIVRYKR